MERGNMNDPIIAYLNSFYSTITHTDDTSFSNLLINIYDNYEISIILISKFYSTITHR